MLILFSKSPGWLDIGSWPPEYVVPPYCSGNVLLPLNSTSQILRKAEKTNLARSGLRDQNFVFTGLLRLGTSLILKKLEF